VSRLSFLQKRRPCPSGSTNPWAPPRF